MRKLYSLLSGMALLMVLSPVAFCADQPSIYLDPVIFAGFDGKEKSAPPAKTLSGKKYSKVIPPYWKKGFSRKEIAFLRMSWTGNRILCLSESGEGSADHKKRTISILNMAGETLKALDVANDVENISFGGEAKNLLVILKNGSSLYYPDIETHMQYKVIPGAGRESLVFPWSRDVLIVHDHPHVGIVPKNDPENVELFVLSADGEPMWTYTELSDSEKVSKTGYRWMFGFLQKKRDNYLLKVSNSGNITMNLKNKLLWKSRVIGTPLSVAVPFFEGRRYAISTSGAQGKIFFLDDKGRELRNVVFRGGASAMSWSTVGNMLAAYGNSDRGQVIQTYSALGSRLWEKVFPEKASGTSKVLVSALGKVITAGVSDSSGRWVVKGWNGSGDELWNIMIEGELIDFYTAWNGRNIVVLSRTESGDLLTAYDSYKAKM